MPVGFVVEDTPVQPHHLADIQICAENVFNLPPCKAGIAVLVEKTLFRRQQGPLAIHVDGAALQNDRRAIAVNFFDFGHFLRDEIVLIPGKIEASFETAPGIEYPVDSPDFAFRVGHESGTAVAHP